MQNQQASHMQNHDQHESLTISQLAQLTGIKAKNIRYYESIGLLPRPARGSNQYRHYSQADVNRLLLLRRIRYLGVPLSEAKALLLGASDAQRLHIQQELLRLVQRRLAALNQEIAELSLFRDKLEQYQRKLANCHPDESDLFCSSDDLSCIVVDAERVCNEHD